MSIIEEFKFTSEPTIINQKVVKFVSRPLINVQLSFNHKINKTPVTCLIDSGCDHNLFPAHWGELIGIPIKKGPIAPYKGIGSSSLTAYSHVVTLYITNTSISFKTNIDFSYEQQVPLLGRSGFFAYFKKVVFDEENNKFILEFKK